MPKKLQQIRKLAYVQKIVFTIDDEGLYDEPIVHTVGEIARVPYPITFQYRIGA